MIRYTYCSFSRWASAPLENWFQNSLKQLSAVQQRQAGLILGASVADAAARPLQHQASEVVQREMSSSPYLSEINDAAYHDTTDPNPFVYGMAPRRDDTFHLRDTKAQRFFSHNSRAFRRGDPSVALHTDERVVSDDALDLHCRFHSFTHRLFAATVQVMARYHGEFPLEAVKQLWVEEASTTQRFLCQEFVNERGTLLHMLNTLLPIPAIYPYASDADLHTYVTPLLKFLEEASPQQRYSIEEEKAVFHPVGISVIIRSCVLVVLSIILRFLQNNPDPIVNTALQISSPSVHVSFAPRAALVKANGRKRLLRDAVGNEGIAESILMNLFPPEVRMACSGFNAPSHSLKPAKDEKYSCSFWEDMDMVCESVSIAAEYSKPCASMTPTESFVQGVQKAIGLSEEGGDTHASVASCHRSLVCHRAMLVGGLLGAKYGVRAIPPEWLSATTDHVALAGFAVDVAQWSWNSSPDHYVG